MVVLVFVVVIVVITVVAIIVAILTHDTARALAMKASLFSKTGTAWATVEIPSL